MVSSKRLTQQSTMQVQGHGVFALQDAFLFLYASSTIHVQS